MTKHEFPFSLITIDLDGTLLNDNHEISQKSISVLNHFANTPEINCHLVLASGRPYITMVPFLNHLNLNNCLNNETQNGAIISFNGAMIRDNATKEKLFEKTLSFNQLQRIYKYCVANNLHLNIYPDGVWTVRETNKYTKLYASRAGIEPVVRPELFEKLLTEESKVSQDEKFESVKCIIISDPQQNLKLRDYWKTELGNDLYITISNAEYLEFLPKGVNKGSAVQFLQDKWNIPTERVACFGDALNDEAMFEVAGYPVAMENAHPTLKQMAKEIAPENNKDGVALTLLKWMQEYGFNTNYEKYNKIQ